MPRAASDYLALSQALNDAMAGELRRLQTDFDARLDRTPFVAAIAASPIPIPSDTLPNPAAPDLAFVDAAEHLAEGLADIAWLIEAFGSEEDLISAMEGFFNLPRIPEGLPRPSPRP